MDESAKADPAAGNLVILGASARAAAWSARRAGWHPWCADLFADVDLQRMATVVRIDDYPAELAVAADRAPAASWIYTGGLENYPQIVDRIARQRPLYGNGGAVLRRVRDPWFLASAAAEAGVCAPALAATSAGLPLDGCWLRKGRRSSGGFQVHIWDERRAALVDDPSASAQDWYYQQRVPGRSCAGAFVATSHGARLLGITEQWVGAAAESSLAESNSSAALTIAELCGARPFHYAGSSGPIELGTSASRQLEQLGEVLAARGQLRGLFGVDFIWDGQQVWPIELNPRYTASLEILESVRAFSAVGVHVAACRDDALPGSLSLPQGWGAKAIYFTRQPLTLSSSAASRFAFSEIVCLSSRWADIPAAGTEFDAGSPVVTLLEGGENREIVEERIHSRLREAARCPGALWA